MRPAILRAHAMRPYNTCLGMIRGGLSPALRYASLIGEIMITIAELRLRVRVELGDETAGAYVWADALLDSYIAAAVRRYSFDLPGEAEITITTTAGVAAYPLPADCLQVTRIEYPAGVFLLHASGGGGTWEEYAGNLVLGLEPASSGDVITVRYRKAYSAPDDEGTPLDVPAGDEDLIVWLVCEAALAWLNKQKDKRLDRRAGYLYPETYAKRYQDWVRARRRVKGVVSRTLAVGAGPR